jgi:hypothetical protein
MHQMPVGGLAVVSRVLARLAKFNGPRGEVRVNSEKRWLKGTPKTKMPAEVAGMHRKQGDAKSVASG